MKKQLFALAFGLAYTLSVAALATDATSAFQEEDSLLMKSAKLEGIYKRFLKSGPCGSHDLEITSQDRNLCIHDKLAQEKVCLDNEVIAQMLVIAYKQNQDKIAGLIEQFGKGLNLEDRSFGLKIEPLNNDLLRNFSVKFTAPSDQDKTKPVIFSVSGQRTENDKDLIAYKTTHEVQDPKSKVRVICGFTQSGIVSEVHGSLKNLEAQELEDKKQEDKRQLAAQEEEVQKMLAEERNTNN